jgi:hypothetical protein
MTVQRKIAKLQPLMHLAGSGLALVFAFGDLEVKQRAGTRCEQALWTCIFRSQNQESKTT